MTTDSPIELITNILANHFDTGDHGSPTRKFCAEVAKEILLAMGDASARKDEGVGEPDTTAETAATSPQPCEICVIDENALQAQITAILHGKKMVSDTITILQHYAIVDIMKAIRPYLRTAEPRRRVQRDADGKLTGYTDPVSVDLEKCIAALRASLHDRTGDSAPWDLLVSYCDHATYVNPENAAKAFAEDATIAVLDTAGVKYVE